MAGKDEKRALICGSVAYDTIMVFPDRFRTHILPDKLHMLNVAFLVPQMRREFGGGPGNNAHKPQQPCATGHSPRGAGARPPPPPPAGGPASPGIPWAASARISSRTGSGSRRLASRKSTW